MPSTEVCVTAVLSSFPLLLSLPHTVTMVSHMWVMQWETTLFCLGKEPGNITDIPFSGSPPSISCSHYQLVLDTLHSSHAKERAFLFLWVTICLYTWHRRKFLIRDNQLTQGARIASQFQNKMGLCWTRMTITSYCDFAGVQYIPKLKLGIKFLLPQIVSQVNVNHLGGGSIKKLAFLLQ